MLRICLNCRSPFRPHPKVPNQKFCSQRECQRARRTIWQRQKRQRDDDYKANQLIAQKNWIKNHPEYWKTYRANHPEYVTRNNNLQKKRNLRYRRSLCLSKGSDGANVKMDKLIRQSSLISGYYMLYPIGSDTIAKMDALMVKIDLISVR